MTKLLKKYREARGSVFSLMGYPFYHFQYADGYDLLVMIDGNNGLLVDKEIAADLIIELQRYIDNFPDELIETNREHVRKRMGDK